MSGVSDRRRRIEWGTTKGDGEASDPSIGRIRGSTCEAVMVLGGGRWDREASGRPSLRWRGEWRGGDGWS